MSFSVNVQLLLVRGALAGLPIEVRDQVEECAAKIRQIMQEYGELGPAALALVGAEEAAGEKSD